MKNKCEGTDCIVCNEGCHDKIHDPLTHEHVKHYEKNMFISMFDNISNSVHVNAIKKGWWEGSRNDAEVIALMHSELSEALESMRNGDPKSKKIPNFKGSEEELADVVIRIMDYSAGNNLDVAGAICEKIKYNEGRSYRHGGKKF